MITRNVKLIKKQEAPIKLYKYCQANEWAEKIITEQKIFFPLPTKFNDIFECSPCYVEPSKIDIENYLKKHNINNPTDKQKIICRKKMNEIVKEELQHTGILCLTTKNDNLLMWAHYAQDHRGVCFEFSPQNNDSYFHEALPVDYNSERKKLNYAKDSKCLVQDIILRKSSDWAVEDERRIIKSCDYMKKESDKRNLNFEKDGGISLEYKKDELTGLYFGARCTVDIINKYKSLCETHGFTNVTFYKMIPGKTEFRLEIVKI